MIFFGLDATKTQFLNLIFVKTKIDIEMKNLFLTLFSLVFITSCSLDDDKNPKYHYEILKVDSFVVPASFTMGETAVITVKYLKPTDCHFFDGFYYEKDLNKRIVAVQSRVLQEQSCPTLTGVIVEKTFNFKATSNGTYVFKFYKGKDANGADLFDEIEIPVI